MQCQWFTAGIIVFCEQLYEGMQVYRTQSKEGKPRLQHLFYTMQQLHMVYIMLLSFQSSAIFTDERSQYYSDGFFSAILKCLQLSV